MTTLTTNWVSDRTYSARAEVEARDCVIEVILKVTTRTPKSITRRENGRRRFISGTTGTSTLSHSLSISDSPATQPLEVVYTTLPPSNYIKAWLRNHDLERYFEAVIQTVYRLQAGFETQPK